MVEDINIINLDTEESLALSMLTTPYYILDSVDWGTITATHHSYKFVNQIGVYVTGTSLGTRDITIIGWVIASTEEEMDSRKDMLNKFINPQNSFRCEYKKYILDFLVNESVKYSTTSKENNEVMCKFQISGTCPDPLFRNNENKREEVATYVPKFHFPLIISESPNPPGGIVFAERTKSLFATVINEGSVSTGFTIVFRALGSVNTPYIQDVNSLEFMRINKTMKAGEEITINTVIGSKSIVGGINGETSNYFKYKSVDSSWLQLKVGENVFAYGAAQNADSLEVLIYHTDKWLEVQECK